MPLEDLMNLSLNQYLGRTIITSGTVFLTVLALFIFGGKVINDFAFLHARGHDRRRVLDDLSVLPDRAALARSSSSPPKEPRR